MAGCCVDKACAADTCMRLPDGKTCRECVYFHRCKSYIGVKGDEAECDWFPRKFRLKLADPSP